MSSRIRIHDRPSNRRPSGRLRRFITMLPVLALVWVLAACASPAKVEDDTSAIPSTDATSSEPAAVAWPRLSPAFSVPTDRPLRAAFVLVDGVYNTELVAPLDLLDHVRYQQKPGIEVFTVSADGEPVTTAEGLRIGADHRFEDAPPADILVVASAEHSRDSDLENEALIAYVRDAGEQAQIVLSLCWGSFVLGEAGLLDGGAATTFPRDFDAFATRFPAVDVRQGPTFVHDGKAITSQGGVRSFDAAMYLIDHLYGPDIARGVGGGLLIDWPYPAHALAPEVIAR